MALNDRALEVIQARRADLARRVAELDLDMIRAWVTAWDELATAFDAALADLMMSATDGTVKGTAVARNARLAEALQQAAERLSELSYNAAVSAEAATATAALEAARSQIDAIKAQLPPEMTVGLTRSWTRVDTEALDSIVKRASERIHAEFYPLSDEAVQAMKRSLVKGIVVGDNPRRVAKEMVRRAEQGFNGGLTRAMVIARTEMLDAHRAAGKSADLQAREVLKGWTWVATLDTKTCPSCVGMHGTEHPIEEDGPIDHHQGRCDRAPLTKSWRELGYDIDEPPSLLQDSQEWYDNLTPDSQLRLMGPTRHELLANGDITLRDLSVRRTTDGWRDAMHVRPVRDLRTLGGTDD